MKYIFLFITIFSTAIFSQYRELEYALLSPALDYYSTNYLNGPNAGMGNAGISGENDLSGISLNPATLSFEKKFQANLQYTFKTNQKITYTYSEFDPSTESEPLPLTISAGIAYKISKNLYTGFIYKNPNNMKLEYPGLQTATGEKYSYTIQVHSFNIPVIYKFKIFSFGIIFNYIYYRTDINESSTIIEPEQSGVSHNWVWQFNGQAGVTITPNKYFSFGLTYTPGFKADVQGPDMISPNMKFVSRFPMKLGAGVEYTIYEGLLRFLADYNFQKLSEISGYKDKHDFNVGTECRVNKNLALRGGFFTFLDTRDFSNSINGTSSDEYKQFFITFGATYKFKGIAASISVLDSHFSNGIIKNTYLNTCLSYNF